MFWLALILVFISIALVVWALFPDPSRGIVRKRIYSEVKAKKALTPLEKLANILKDSDGYVIVSAEYNHSIPAALKNLIDHYMKEYFFKPSAIVTYSVGGFGGVRAGMHLRSILPEVGMSSIPSIFSISKIQKSFDENGKPLDKNYPKRVVKFLDEFEWYVNALKDARSKGVPY